MNIINKVKSILSKLDKLVVLANSLEDVRVTNGTTYVKFKDNVVIDFPKNLYVNVPNGVLVTDYDYAVLRPGYKIDFSKHNTIKRMIANCDAHRLSKGVLMTDKIIKFKEREHVST